MYPFVFAPLPLSLSMSSFFSGLDRINQCYCASPLVLCVCVRVSIFTLRAGSVYVWRRGSLLSEAARVRLSTS